MASLGSILTNVPFASFTGLIELERGVNLSSQSTTTRTLPKPTFFGPLLLGTNDRPTISAEADMVCELTEYVKIPSILEL